MIKFIHCADIHLGKIQNNLDQRFEDFGNAFRYVLEEAVAREVNFLLIAGDLFDKRNINARTLEQAVEILELAKQAKIQVIAIEGNHDKAFLRDKDSWMSFLAHRGYIILLKPEFQGGKIVVEAYDRETCTGTYIDLDGNIRVYGLGYLGRAAGSKLEELAPLLPEDRFNIVLLHAMVGRMGGDLIGSISKGDVTCLKEQVVYLALGHGHNRYMVERMKSVETGMDGLDVEVQLVSGGHDEKVELEETKQQNGDDQKKGSDADTVQINLFDWVADESAVTQEVDLTVEEDDVEFVSERVELCQVAGLEQVLTKEEDFSHFWGHNPGSIEHCRLDEAGYHQGFYYVEMEAGSVQKVEHILTKSRPAKIVVVDITGADQPEIVYEKILAEVKKEVDDLEQPLLRLVIKGEIHFDVLEIDEEYVQSQIDLICAPLILEIEMRANLPELSIGEDVDLLDRQAIEREVLKKKVEERSQWRYLGDELVDLMLEVKEDVLSGLPAEEVLAKVMAMVGDQDEDS